MNILSIKSFVKYHEIIGEIDKSCGIKAENFLLSECETRTTYIGREVDIYIKTPTPSLTDRKSVV